MNQTLAIFLDAYRELNARKLFWVVLILSGVVVLAFLGLSVGDQGIQLFGMQVGRPFPISPDDRPLIYKTLFFELGVQWWLTWIATILALISTAGIFPELLTGGSIDLFLSKPIGRVRLFLTKYVAGLAFVFLQVFVFSAASFLVLGIRGGVWVPGVFLAVPVVVCFFSYVYSVCVLLGVITRSTLMALLLAGIFWIVVIGTHVAERQLLRSQIKDEIVAARYDRQIREKEADLAKFQAAAAATTEPSVLQQARVTTAQARLADLRARLKEISPTKVKWHEALYAAKTLLPKTTETVQLLKRWLISATEFQNESRDAEADAASDEPKKLFFNVTTDDIAAEVRTQKALRERSVTWVVGTSLGFEAVMVGLAAFVFWRRDY